MDRLSDFRLFLAVIDAGSLVGGGRRLHLSPASVSERIAALEASLGVRLLVRTTRSLMPTDEGRAFADAARNMLGEIDEITARLRDGVTRLSGRVRLSAPIDLGRNRIAPVIDRFLADHPEVSIELLLSDAISDLIAEDIDFAIRLGALEDSSQTAIKIADNRRVACAAPAYLASAGIPSEPAALRDHTCLVMRFGQRRDDRWHFVKDGRDVTVKVTGTRAANDGDLIRRWAIAGHGIAMKSVADIGTDLATGRLVEVLSDFSKPAGALQIVYTAGRMMPRRSRMVMECIVDALKSGSVSCCPQVPST